jgi:hypothetical protein
VIDDRRLSPFSASGQIIASVNSRRANNDHAMALGPGDSLERILSGRGDLPITICPGFAKISRSDIADLLMPM